MKHQCTQEETLLEALAKLAPDSSKTTLRSWIEQGRVEVNGTVVKKNQHPLLPGDIVSLGRKPSREPLDILYEDRHLIVIDKPSSLLSVSAAYETEKTAHALLKERFKPNRVFVVHRLDQDTSGVMLFALSPEAYEKLKKTFEDHDLDRIYMAIVEGAPPQKEGTWQSYLYEDANYRVHSSDDPKRGEKAITHYKEVARSKAYTLLELKLETGKKNQIRVHCQQAGCPIVGDQKYGATTNPIKRLGLHSHVLRFKHPITGKHMSFTSPLPAQFKRLV